MMRRLVRAGLLVALVDGCFASAFGVFVRHVTVARVWQGVASVALGPGALNGGLQAVAVGVAMHILVAFTWSALFLLALRRVPRIQTVLDSSFGALKVAAVVGPVIWLVMSLVVIPTIVHRMPAFTGAYLAMLIGHIFFVGLPMVVATGEKR